MGLADKILNIGRTNPVEQLGNLPLWQRILGRQQGGEQNILTDYTNNIKGLKTYKFEGTNYDPTDPNQTRVNTDGTGRVGVPADNTMLATSTFTNKEGEEEGFLRSGTIVYFPKTNELRIVADTMNERFNKNKLDFASVGTKKQIIDKYQGDQTAYIIKDGVDIPSARKFIESGEWKKMHDKFKKEGIGGVKP